MLGIIAGLAATGALLCSLVTPVVVAQRAHEGGGRPGGRAEGAAFGMLGGWRAILADLTWLHVQAVWEQRDLPATGSALRLVTTLDPRSLYFWLNGARMIAYDMPAWRIAAAGGYGVVPTAEQRRIDGEQARLALARLDAAMDFHPASAALWIERANIESYRLHDLAAAADSYRRAARQPDAPYYAARIYGELLRRLGRNAEALAWLRQLHPSLPRDDENAGAAVVLARIRELERELGVVSSECYVEPRRAAE